jgi:hypothetical protein
LFKGNAMPLRGKCAVPPSRPYQIVSRTLRLALAVVVGWFGWSVARTAYDLFGTAASGPVVTRPWNAAPGPGLKDLLGGGWSFGDSDWSFRWERLAVQQVLTRLQAEAESSRGAAHPSPLELAVIGWLRRAGEACPCAGGTVYTARLRQGRLRAVTQRTAGGECLRLVQSAWPVDATHWQLVEGRPQSGGGKGASRDHLLPLPPGIATPACRWDDAGHLRGELVGPASAGDLEARWRAAGWSIEALPPGELPEGKWCRRGSEAVLVVVWGTPATAAGDFLLLVGGPAQPQFRGDS